MSDEIHALIRAEIQQRYQELNGISCPWDGSEGKALSKMIRANPSWTIEQWLLMVSNYFGSDDVNGARPRLWLPQVSKWARGPLDRFGHMKGAGNGKAKRTSIDLLNELYAPGGKLAKHAGSHS